MPLGWWPGQTGQFGLTAHRRSLHKQRLESIIQTELGTLSPTNQLQGHNGGTVNLCPWLMYITFGGTPEIINNICFPGAPWCPKDCTSYVAVSHLSPLEKIMACTLGVVIRCLQVFKETLPVVTEHSGNKENYTKWGCPWFLGGVFQRNNFLAICMQPGGCYSYN